ncbi:MAG: phospholipase D-like domain-containing protein [Bdellovibrionota bacterium]
MEKTFSALLVSILLASAGSAKADEVKYISHAEEALAAFMSLPAKASHTIGMTTYLFEPCNTSGQMMLRLLASRARAGVKVRVLLDGDAQRPEQARNLADYFAKNKMSLKFYNQGSIFNIGINLRLHAKMLVADNTSYIAGGRNIADDYFSLSEKSFIDGDLLVSGKSAQAAARSFKELWNGSLASIPDGRPERFISWNRFCQKDLSRNLASLKTMLTERGVSALGKVNTQTCAQVSFVNDSPEFGNPIYGEGSIYDKSRDSYMTDLRLTMKRATNTFLSFVRGTKRSLDIENRDYIPTGEVDDALAELRTRRIPVEVITNADMEGGESGLVLDTERELTNRASRRDTIGSERVFQVSGHGTLDDKHELSSKNARFSIHAKVAVRDKKDVLVGSFNIDPRSYHTNVEAQVLVRNCPALARDVASSIHSIRKTYLSDVKARRIHPPEEPDFWAKALSFLAYNFF